MHKSKLIIAILFITSGIFYYQLTLVSPEQTTATITQITDGDTIKTADITIRLKGINTPEKSQPFYEEAKQFLAQIITNKSATIESHGIDKYGRTLAHVFLKKQHINELILKEGLATLYYYEPDAYYDNLKQAEEFARINQKGLWKKSPNKNCIELIEFKTNEPEILILQNNCDKILNITFKDDATHIYQTTIQPKQKFTKTFSHVWNNDGDSIYITDNQGLILFFRY